MKKYEYEVIEMSSSPDMQSHFLNQYAEDGWELVAITPAVYTGGSMITAKAYMKRETCVTDDH